MTIYLIENGKAKPVQTTTFQREGIRERDDIQKVLRESIGMIVPNAMVIDEEYGDWSDSRRRIDLLCLKQNGNLAVV